MLTALNVIKPITRSIESFLIFSLNCQVSGELASEKSIKAFKHSFQGSP